MFETKTFSTVDRGIAAVLAVAMVCWAVGAHYTAQAGGLTTITDVLSTSEPGVVANHTITFTLPDNTPDTTGIDTDDVIQLTMPVGFTVPALVDADVDVAINTTDDAMATDWDVSVLGQVISITSTGGTAAAGDEIEIEIGTNATNEVTGTNQITNHATAGSYELLIEVVDEGTTLQDSNSTVLVMVEQVTVTADVDPIFNFFVTGTSTGTVLDTETMTATTTATTIPFGTLGAGTPGIGAQELRVVTNARSGFSVTVFTDQQLTASNGADINSFSDGTDVSTPTTWAAPTGTIGDNTTYGHWGLRSSDADIATAFADNEYEHVPLAATPREVFDHNAPTDGYNSPVDNGHTRVLYKAEIMSFQEAADDYTATLTYVATPTF